MKPQFRIAMGDRAELSGHAIADQKRPAPAVPTRSDQSGKLGRPRIMGKLSQGERVVQHIVSVN